MSKNRNEELGALAHRYIPGGAHTYSRGDDQYPINAPRVMKRGQGAYAWDVDGNKFLDFGMALRSVTVGYNYERISRAAIEQIGFGNNLTRASEVEVLAAQDICELIPWCEMVKFAKNGSTVVTAATKLARAFTGRSLIARCADQPFFSYDDWFIGDTAITSGIPGEIAKLTTQFRFNDLGSVEAMFANNPGKIACIVCEPATNIEPAPGFLQGMIDTAHKHGAIVILDEMISGFRWHLKGACHHYGVKPDLVTFGKGMANGFSVAALGGRREIMRLGGIDHDGERLFLISTTHGAEMCGLGAFRETLKVYAELGVTEHLWKAGKALCDGLNGAAREMGIAEKIEFSGTACSPAYVCRDASGQVSMPFRTLFSQEMIKQGVLMPWIALCYEHGANEIEMGVRAGTKALEIYRRALTDGIEKHLAGPAIKPVFRKFN